RSLLLCRPFRAAPRGAIRIPGRCPGLVYFGPFGATEAFPIRRPRSSLSLLRGPYREPVGTRLGPESEHTAMRRSEAAVALIRREQDGRNLWLAQWNPKWRRYHFVSGHRRPDETFRACLVREIAEELRLREGPDYQVSPAPPIHLEFRDYSERTQTQ